MEIECEFGKKLWIDGHQHETLYTCFVTSKLTEKLPGAIEKFKGAHLNGRSNGDVRAVRFMTTAIEEVPKVLSETFPNMTHLQICGCELKRVARRDLMGLEKLTHLFLDSNSLTSLPDDLFMYTPNLEVIRFDCNYLNRLTSELFAPLNKGHLVYVDFRRNDKIDVFFKRGVAGSVESIRQLLECIDENCLEPAENRRKEDFSLAVMKRFEALWHSKDLSDFTITTGTKEFQVHKTILSIHSSVFAELLHEQQNSTHFTMDEFSEDAVEQFLLYCYTGELREDFSVKEIHEIAEKFDVPNLKKICK